MEYNWIALLIFLAGVIALTKLAKWLTFKHPELARMRDINATEDRKKKDLPKYRPMIKKSQMAGLGTNLFFLILAMPFFLTLEAQPIWRYLSDIVLIFLLYDLVYYLTHRFLFHGNAYFRRVHGVHHQARKPTYVDSHYVHPLETVIGLSALFLSVIAVALYFGPLHAGTFIVLFFVYTQQNQINHVYFDINRAPFKVINYITDKHQIHHINMNKGNYASLSPLYDWMFGTLE